MLFVMWVYLSNSSLKPRLRRNSSVTGECGSVNRQLETAISGSLFFSGTWLLFVRCFLVSLMQVWSRWKTSCACEGSV